MQARVAAEVLRFDDDAEHVGADVVGGRDLTIIVVVARVRSQLGRTGAGVADHQPSRQLRGAGQQHEARSEEHTSELQSLMRISYAVFCLKKKTSNAYNINNKHIQ